MHELPLKGYGLLGLLALLVVAALVSPSLAQEGARVYLEPIALRLERDETAEIAIRVEGVTDLAGAEVHLVYDSDLLEVVDAYPGEEGVQITHAGFLPADFVAQNRADGGRIDYAVARMPPHEPVSGDGDLAIITVRAKEKGRGTVAIQSVILADPDGRPIPVEAVTEPVVLTVDGPSDLLACWPAGTLLAAAIGVGLVAGLKRSFDQSRKVV